MNFVSTSKADLTGSSSCFSPDMTNSFSPSQGEPLHLQQFDWSTLEGELFLPNMSGVIPEIMSQTQTDDEFVERLTRFLCSGGKSFSDLKNFLDHTQSVSPCLEVDTVMQQPLQLNETEPFAGGKEEACVFKTTHESGLGSKRRKIGGQDTSCVRIERASQHCERDRDDGTTTNNDVAVVRAKRGQATNKHSLAERARRAKISEKMDILENLVPGNKQRIRKANRMDEIIEYVLSLQRQVEYLSMKLTSFNPGLELDIDNLLKKTTVNSNDSEPISFDCRPLHPHHD